MSGVYLLFFCAIFLTKDSWANSRGALVLAWTLSMILFSLGRCAIMLPMARRSWWGVPVLVIGAGNTGRSTL
jgi:hypothetical protein